MVLTRSARPVAERVLEVRVAARDLLHARERLLGERRAAEVRVYDDARRVQHPPEPRRARGDELLAQPRLEIAGIRSRTYLFTRAREYLTRGVDGKGIVDAARELVHRRQVAQLHAESVGR